MNSTRPPERLSKRQTLRHWKGLPKHRTPLDQVMEAVPYAHTGSSFTKDTIRVTGSRPFIDAVMSHLKELLTRENDTERLDLNYAESTDRITREPTGAWTFYVKVHERGGQ